MHHTHVVCAFACYFKVRFSLSQSLAWDKQEAKFKVVMSVQKHLLHSQDLACLCSILHLKNHYFFISLIFSFISDLVGKLVQLEAYWILEEGEFTTLLQRREVEVNNAGLVFTTQRRDISTSRRCDVVTLIC